MSTTNPADEQAAVTTSDETVAVESNAVAPELDSQYGIDCFPKLPQIVQEGAELERSGDTSGAETKYLEALKITASAQAAALLNLARVCDDPEVTRSYATLAFFNLERAGLENSALAKFAITLLDLMPDNAPKMNRQERRAAERKARKAANKGSNNAGVVSSPAEHVHTEHCKH